MIDPLGFALEGFDAVGAWRTHEAGAPIDASSRLADGRAVNGVGELRAALTARPDAFVQTLTEKLMTYALGRGLQDYDMPVVRAIVRDAKARELQLQRDHPGDRAKRSISDARAGPRCRDCGLRGDFEDGHR